MGRPSCRLRYHGTAILASAVCRNCTLSPKSQVPVTGKKKPAEFVEDQCGKGGQPFSLKLLFFLVVAVIISHIEICTVLSVCPSSVSLCVSICLYRSISLHLMIDGETSQRVDE